MVRCLRLQFVPHIMLSYVCFCLLFNGVSFAQAPSDLAFDRLREAVVTLSGRYDKDSVQRAQLIELRQVISDLRGLYHLSGGSFPDDYVLTINYNTSVIAGAIEGRQERDAVDSVYNDVAAKIMFALNQSSGFGGAPPALVNVSVVTRRGSAEVGGYQIRAVPFRHVMANSGIFELSFGRLSSPTQRNIPPGRYKIIVMDANNNVIAERPADIGIDGNKDVVVEVALP